MRGNLPFDQVRDQAEGGGSKKAQTSPRAVGGPVPFPFFGMGMSNELGFPTVTLLFSCKP